MALTPKQENFALAYLETGNASEAYRRAYATKAKPETVHRRAKELLKNGPIAARIAELKAPAVARALLTLEQHLLDLQELRDEARTVAQFGPAITAEVARGKAAGLQVERSQHTHKGHVTIAVVDPYAKPGGA